MFFQKPIKFVVLFTCFLFTLLFVSLYAFKLEIESVPEPDPAPQQLVIPLPKNFVPETFEWHATETDFSSIKEQFEETKRMLRYVDEQIYLLDRRAYTTGRMVSNHKERAEYLQVRVFVLHHIYNLSQYVDLEDVDIEE